MSEDNAKDVEIGDAGGDAGAAEKTPAKKTPVDKSAKKEKRKKKVYPPTRPPCTEMVIEALSNLGEPSIQAIKKYLTTEYGCEMDAKMTWYVRNCLGKGVASGKFIQTSGQGPDGNFKANGCFKLGSLLQPVSKPTKRQIASAEAAAEMKAKAIAQAKRLSKKPKKKSRGKQSVVKKAAKRPKAKPKKPAAKKAAKPSEQRGRPSKARGRKGRK